MAGLGCGLGAERGVGIGRIEGGGGRDRRIELGGTEESWSEWVGSERDTVECGGAGGVEWDGVAVGGREIVGLEGG